METYHKTMPPKGKGKGKRAPRRAKKPATRARRSLSLGPLEPSDPDPFMYMARPEPYMDPVRPADVPPLHPDNIIQEPIRRRITEKRPSPAWLKAQEAPRRLNGKQESPLWVAVKNDRVELDRAVAARDAHGRFVSRGV